MKCVVFFLNLFLLLLFYGCNVSIEERIEDKFMDYVNENFDDPSEVEKITSITISDSSDVKSFLENIEYLVNDSTKYEINTEQVLEKVEAMPYSKRYESREYAEEYVEKSMNFLNFKLENIEKLKCLSDSIRNYMSRVKPSDYDYLYTYDIKVRMNKKGFKKILVFYAIVNAKTQEIKIQDHELKSEEVPILKDIYKCVDEYMELKREYMDLYIEFKESEKNLLMRL